MSRTLTVGDVEHVASKLYSRQKPDQIEGQNLARQIRSGVSITGDYDLSPSSVAPVLVEGLQVSTSPMTIIFAAQALGHIIATRFPKALSSETLTATKDAVLQCLCRRCGELETSSLNAIAVLLCGVMKAGLTEIDSFRNLAAEVCDACGTGGLTLPPTSSGSASTTRNSPSMLALHFFETLLEDIQEVYAHWTGAFHRKILQTFRDAEKGVRFVFELCFDTLSMYLENARRGVATVVAEGYLQKLLTVAEQCLCYNFSLVFFEGEGPGDSPIPFPMDWRDLIVSERSVECFWGWYHLLCTPEQRQAVVQNATEEGTVICLVKCLSSLVQLVGTRRSIFLFDNDRMRRAKGLLRQYTQIMGNYIGVTKDPEVLTEFCRLLNRTALAFSLRELTQNCEDEYETFFSALKTFTATSFQGWHIGHVASLSLTSLWARLVKNYTLEHDTAFKIRSHITLSVAQEIVGEYVSSRLTMASKAFEDGLDDAESMELQYKFVATVIRAFYEQFTTWLLSTYWNPLLEGYENLLLSCRTAAESNANAAQISAFERQLYFLVKLHTSCTKSCVLHRENVKDVDTCNADLIAALFKLTSVLQTRRTSNPSLGTNSHPSCFGGEEIRLTVLENLELSILDFFEVIRTTALADGFDLVSSSDVIGALKDRLADCRGCNDDDLMNRLVAAMVEKILHHCEVWHQSSAVLKASFQLFHFLMSSFQSSATLLQLPALQRLMTFHQQGATGAPNGEALSSQPFPFLSQVATRRTTKAYHLLIATLLLRSKEKPLEQLLRQYCCNTVIPLLGQLETMRMQGEQQPREGSDSLRPLVEFITPIATQGRLIILFYELRGIFAACTSEREYRSVFALIIKPYEKLFQALAAAVQRLPPSDVTCDGHLVTTLIEVGLLRFLQEIAMNSGGGERLNFPPHSTHGLVLFRICATAVFPILCRRLELVGQQTQGGEAPTNTSPPLFPIPSPFDVQSLSVLSMLSAGGEGKSFVDAMGCVENRNDNLSFSWWFKPLQLCFRLVKELYSGNWCNFAVFGYYQDPLLSALTSTVSAALVMLPVPDLDTQPKLQTAYFSALRGLLQAHPSFFFEYDQSTAVGQWRWTVLQRFLSDLHSSLLTVESADVETVIPAGQALGSFLSWCHEERTVNPVFSGVPSPLSVATEAWYQSHGCQMLPPLMETVFTNFVCTPFDVVIEAHNYSDTDLAHPLLSIVAMCGGLVYQQFCEQQVSRLHERLSRAASSPRNIRHRASATLSSAASSATLSLSPVITTKDIAEKTNTLSEEMTALVKDIHFEASVNASDAYKQGKFGFRHGPTENYDNFTRNLVQFRHLVKDLWPS